jgi:tetratricopeptide (TPR) repeat protein
MIVPAFCLLATTRGGIDAALKTADAEFARAYPYPTEDPRSLYLDALDLYRRIEKVYGPDARAEGGIGRCMFRLGSYRQAAAAFTRAGAGYAGDLSKANSYQSVADAINLTLATGQVVQLVQIPKRDRWIAVTAVRDPQDGGFAMYQTSGASVNLFRLNSIGDKVTRIGKPMELPDSGYDGQSPFLYLVRRSKRTISPTVLVFTHFPAADCSPSSTRLFEIAESGLKKREVFNSLADAAVFAPTQERGLRIVAAPTFKVWWPDVYVWKSGRFVIDNRDEADLYRGQDWGWTSREADSYYPLWLRRAALYAIRGEFRRSEAACKRALTACRKTLHYQSIGSSSRYHDVGFYGKASVNLREIEQRIRWLKRGDHNHLLLYRPYDFGLQIPPYRLGNAHIPGMPE